MLRSIVARTAIAAAGATLLLSSAVRADDVKLPSSLTFTAYDTGSSGFRATVGGTLTMTSDRPSKTWAKVTSPVGSTV